MTEIFKKQHSLNLRFVKEICVFKNNQHGLRNEHPVKSPRPRTTNFGEKGLSFVAGKLWNELSLETRVFKHQSV